MPGKVSGAGLHRFTQHRNGLIGCQMPMTMKNQRQQRQPLQSAGGTQDFCHGLGPGGPAKMHLKSILQHFGQAPAHALILLILVLVQKLV